MLDRRKLLGPRSAHAQARRVFTHQVREARLDLTVAPFQRVIVRIADQGRIVAVIANIVRRNLVGQRGQLFERLGFGKVGWELCLRHV